jgi:hypothetical protein
MNQTPTALFRLLVAEQAGETSEQEHGRFQARTGTCRLLVTQFRTRC